MKSLKEIVEESKQSQVNESGNKFNQNISSHAKNYNSLLKWYDKCIKTMDKDEVIDLLKHAIDWWTNNNFDTI